MPEPEVFAEPTLITREVARTLFGFNGRRWRSATVDKLRRNGFAVESLEDEYYFDRAEIRDVLSKKAAKAKEIAERGVKTLQVVGGKR